MEHVLNSITQKLDTTNKATDSELIFSKRKALNALFPYAIFLEQGGQQGLINAISRTARALNFYTSNRRNFVWYHVVLYISRLFEKRNPTSLNRAITLISPYVPWEGTFINTVAVSRWAEAALTIPYTEEVGQDVINVLLQISPIGFLQPHIPIEIWRWLRRRPPLPFVHRSLNKGGVVNVIAHVPKTWGRRHSQVVPSSLDTPGRFTSQNFHGMKNSVREDFGRDGMGHHRQDLIEQLHLVLGLLDRKDQTTIVQKAKVQYAKLEGMLLDMQKQ
jgi:hypothetical protein